MKSSHIGLVALFMWVQGHKLTCFKDLLRLSQSSRRCHWGCNHCYLLTQAHLSQFPREERDRRKSMKKPTHVIVNLGHQRRHPHVRMGNGVQKHLWCPLSPLMKVKKILWASAYSGIHVTTLSWHLSGLMKLRKAVEAWCFDTIRGVGRISHENGWHWASPYSKFDYDWKWQRLLKCVSIIFMMAYPVKGGLGGSRKEIRDLL